MFGHGALVEHGHFSTQPTGPTAQTRATTCVRNVMLGWDGPYSDAKTLDWPSLLYKTSW